MNDPEARYARLMKAYPKRYRDERGEEILATLLDTSPDDASRPPLRDALDIVCHGLQRRLGLTSERFGGRVLEIAAMPGLAMGAAFAVFLFIWGEWIPVSKHFAVYIGSGPFLTIGPIIYLVWLLGAAASLVWPQSRRTMAASCVAITVVVWPIGKIFFMSPNFWQMAILASLGLPGVLAPTTGYYHRQIAGSLAAGAAAFAIVWWFGTLHLVSPPYRLSFYVYGNYFLGQGIPWLAGTIVLATGVLFILRKPDIAGALVVLTSPLWIVAAAFVRDANGVDGRVLTAFVAVGAVCLLAPIVWLAAAWFLDLRSPAAERIDSM
jgi:hypothetical protein